MTFSVQEEVISVRNAAVDHITTNIPKLIAMCEDNGTRIETKIGASTALALSVDALTNFLREQREIA